MRRLLTIRSFNVLILAGAVLVFYSSSGALTEKEQWLKDNAASIEIHPADPPLILDNGGPDGFGYYYIDSEDDANNAPEFNWIDISGYGINMNITEDDQNAGPFPVGFTFNYYGNDFVNFYACSNGWASFTSTLTNWSNVPIPTISEPNDLLAVFWDDLHPQDLGQAYYYTNNTDSCIISWHDFGHYSGPSTYSFQIILTADGNIYYQYLSLTGTLDSHTIGIENSNGSIGLQYVYNTFRDESGTAIYFGLEGPIYAEHDVNPVAFLGPFNIGPVGDPFDTEVRIKNGGNDTESFAARLVINHDGEVYDETEQVVDLDPSSTVDIMFPSYAPNEEGIFELVAITELAGDEIPANDTIRMEFTAFASIYVEDFEDDNGFFEPDNDWEWGDPSSGPGDAHSGVNLWGTILNGQYSVGPLLSALVSPPLGLTTDPILTFWHWYNTEIGFDGGNVKISTDGINWDLITPEGGYDGILSTNFENPIGGEEAFFGESDGWELETFDLSAYNGSMVLIKFDFGSDTSVRNAGWYMDDFVVYGGGGGEPGSIAGVVTDLASGSPIEGAIVETGAMTDTTGSDGSYILELIPGIYSVTASAIYHNSVTVHGVEVFEDQITIQDFDLPAPVIQIDTTPIDTIVAVGQTVEFIRNLANVGNGDLSFNAVIRTGNRLLRSEAEIGLRRKRETVRRVEIDPAYELNERAPAHGFGDPPTVLDFADEVFTFETESQTGDPRCLGVEFDGQYFWVTGANDLVTHYLHKFDRDGNHINTFNQGTSSDWGWRDLAWDGTYLYASDEYELAVIDPNTGQKIDELPMPTSISPPLRALAWDPETDLFWSANFGSNIIKFDRSGQTLATYANSYIIYGMAWDNVSEGGPWLWVFSQDGTPQLQISQFDPVIGSYTDVVFYAIDHSGGDDAVAGGLCFTTDWEPTLGVVFGLV
ncbi:MAG: carboxypeptidase regulatory-like domain-containing protein, partial [candidate division Zixibacteria bacterium]